MENFQNTSILAGNSRVYLDPDTGHLTVEPQLAAFRAGIRRAVEISNETGALPQVSVAFDHMGIFSKQFLGDGLTNSQKRRPKVSQLRSEIVEVFQKAADDIGIALSSVKAIHEDAARDHASRMTDRDDFPKDLLDVFLRKLNPGEEDKIEIFKQSGDHYVRRVTCAAITTEYFKSSAGTAETLEVFIEDDGWTKEALYKRGAGLMSRIGHPLDVKLFMVNKQDGYVQCLLDGDQFLPKQVA